MSYVKYILDFANEFIKEAEIDLIVAEKLLSDLDLSKCESNEIVFGIGRRALYSLQQASEKAIKALILVYFKPMLHITVSTGEEREPSTSYCKISVERLKRLEKLFDPEKIGHLPALALICLTNETIKLKDSIARRILASLRKLGRLLRMDEDELEQDIKKGLDIFLGILNLEPKIWEEIEYICSAWEQRDQKKVMSKLRYFIPCIEYRLETLAKLRAIRIDERTLSKSHSFLIKINKILEDVKKSPSLAEALGSKEKAEKVADAILKWFEFMKDSIPSINHIIAHAFTISICLWVYQSIGRYPRDAKSVIDVYVKRNEICRDVKSIGKLVDEVKTLVSQVRSLIENISPRLLELESALRTIPSNQ
jgi:hypothetical protein